MAHPYQQPQRHPSCGRGPPAQSNSGASSSHEAPQSYYPPIRKPERPPTNHPEDQDPEATRPMNNQPAAATTGPHQPRPSFVDDRQLRRSQRSQAGSPSTPTQASPPHHGRPSDTPLAAQLRDGRQIGPKPPPKEDPDPQPDKDDPSFMQQSCSRPPSLKRATQTLLQTSYRATLHNHHKKQARTCQQPRP